MARALAQITDEERAERRKGGYGSTTTTTAPPADDTTGSGGGGGGFWGKIKDIAGSLPFAETAKAIAEPLQPGNVLGLSKGVSRAPLDIREPAEVARTLRPSSVSDVTQPSRLALGRAVAPAASAAEQGFTDFLRTIDAPRALVQSAAKEAYDAGWIRPGGISSKPVKGFNTEEFWQQFKDRKAASDYLEEEFPNLTKWVTKPLGFGIDVVTDPLNALGGPRSAVTGMGGRRAMGQAAARDMTRNTLKLGIAKGKLRKATDFDITQGELAEKSLKELDELEGRILSKETERARIVVKTEGEISREAKEAASHMGQRMVNSLTKKGREKNQILKENRAEIVAESTPTDGSAPSTVQEITDELNELRGQQRRLIGAETGVDSVRGEALKNIAAAEDWGEELTRGIEEMIKPGGKVTRLTNSQASVILGEKSAGLRLRPFWRTAGGPQILSHEQWGWLVGGRGAYARIAPTPVAQRLGRVVTNAFHNRSEADLLNYVIRDKKSGLGTVQRVRLADSIRSQNARAAASMVNARQGMERQLFDRGTLATSERGDMKVIAEPIAEAYRSAGLTPPDINDLGSDLLDYVAGPGLSRRVRKAGKKREELLPGDQPSTKYLGQTVQTIQRLVDQEELAVDTSKKTVKRFGPGRIKEQSWAWFEESGRWTKELKSEWLDEIAEIERFRFGRRAQKRTPAEGLGLFLSEHRREIQKQLADRTLAEMGLGISLSRLRLAKRLRGLVGEFPDVSGLSKQLEARARKIEAWEVMAVKRANKRKQKEIDTITSRTNQQVSAMSEVIESGDAVQAGARGKVEGAVSGSEQRATGAVTDPGAALETFRQKMANLRSALKTVRDRGAMGKNLEETLGVDQGGKFIDLVMGTDQTAQRLRFYAEILSNGRARLEGMSLVESKAIGRLIRQWAEEADAVERPWEMLRQQAMAEGTDIPSQAINWNLLDDLSGMSDDVKRAVDLDSDSQPGRQLTPQEEEMLIETEAPLTEMAGETPDNLFSDVARKVDEALDTPSSSQIDAGDASEGMRASKAWVEDPERTPDELIEDLAEGSLKIPSITEDVISNISNFDVLAGRLSREVQGKTLGVEGVEEGRRLGMAVSAEGHSQVREMQSWWESHVSVFENVRPGTVTDEDMAKWREKLISTEDEMLKNLYVLKDVLTQGDEIAVDDVPRLLEMVAQSERMEKRDALRLGSKSRELWAELDQEPGMVAASLLMTPPRAAYTRLRVQTESMLPVLRELRSLTGDTPASLIVAKPGSHLRTAHELYEQADRGYKVLDDLAGPDYAEMDQVSRARLEDAVITQANQLAQEADLLLTQDSGLVSGVSTNLANDLYELAGTLGEEITAALSRQGDQVGGAGQGRKPLLADEIKRLRDAEAGWIEWVEQLVAGDIGRMQAWAERHSTGLRKQLVGRAKHRLTPIVGALENAGVKPPARLVDRLVEASLESPEAMIKVLRPLRAQAYDQDVKAITGTLRFMLGNVKADRAFGLHVKSTLREYERSGMYTSEEFAEMVESFTRPESMGRMLAGAEKMMNVWKGWAVTSPGFIVRNGYSAALTNMMAGVSLDTQMRMSSQYMHRLFPDWERAQAFLAPFFGRSGRQYGRDSEYQDFINLASTHGGIMNEGMAADELTPVSGALGLWGLTGATRRGNTHVENMVRLSMAYDTYRNAPGSVDARMGLAQARVAKFHFDYTDVSNLERGIKTVVPFYTWMSRNWVLQAQLFRNRPQTMLTFERALEDIDESTPVNPFPALYFNDPNFKQFVGRWFLAHDMPYISPIKDLGNMYPRDWSEGKSTPEHRQGGAMHAATSYLGLGAEAASAPVRFALEQNPIAQAVLAFAFQEDLARGYELTPGQQLSKGAAAAFPVFGRVQRMGAPKETQDWRSGLLSLFGVPLRRSDPEAESARMKQWLYEYEKSLDAEEDAEEMGELREEAREDKDVLGEEDKELVEEAKRAWRRYQERR